jgi:L-arabinonolactonase
MEPAIEVLDIPLLALGEGPVWSPAAGAFFWLDIKDCGLHRLIWAERRHDRFDLPAEVGCMALMEDGDLALALPDALCRFRPGESGLRRIGGFDPGGPNRRSNDGAVDRQGRFWFSTVADPGWRDEPTGRLWCCDARGHVHLVMQGLFMPNGTAAAADGETLYVSDSHPDVRRIWSFRLDGDAGLGDAGLTGRSLFFDTAGRPGRPDGAALDEAGGYWMAGVGGAELVRIAPDGRADRVIPLPVSHPTKACFGGPELDVLLITTIQPAAVGVAAEPTEIPGGSVLIMRPGVHGLAQKPFVCR